MKKWKIAYRIIAFILIVATIAGTCYVFFRDIKQKCNPYSTIHSFVAGAENSLYYDKLNAVADYCDTRFDCIILTNQNLDEILTELLTYVQVYNNGEVDDATAYNTLAGLTTTRDDALLDYDEYITKMETSATFASKKEMNANNSYNSACQYLVNYADFVQSINLQVANAQTYKNVDAKFDVFDLYCNIVKESFGNLKTESNLVKLSDDTNIKYINTYFELNCGCVDVNSEFSVITNNFSTFYNKIDKNTFAKNFKQNILAVTTLANCTTDEQKTAYYLKVMGYGV